MAAEIFAKTMILTSVVVVAVALTAAGVYLIVSPGNPPIVTGSELKKFSSPEEMKSYIKTSLEAGSYGSYFGGPYFGGVQREVLTTTIPAAAPESGAAGGAKSEDYSTTNIQVAGVDEADIVKNDGKYIYTISGNKIVIVDAYPAEVAEILSEIEEEGSVIEIFINKDRLLVFGQQTSYGYIGIPERGIALPSPTVVGRPDILPYYTEKMFVHVYDISNRANPTLVRNLSVDGSYFDTRMIGDYVYVVVNAPISDIENPIVPKIYSESRPITSDFPDVYYFDNPDYSYRFVTIMSLNTQTEQEPNSQRYMMGWTSNMYVSTENIYITYQKHFSYFDFIDRIIDEALIPVLPEDVAGEVNEIRGQDSPQTEKVQKIGEVFAGYFNKLSEKERQALQEDLLKRAEPVQQEIAKEMERTVIHKIAINAGNIEYKAQGSVPGNVLNQFSMDENKGFFRIATTTSQFTGREVRSLNHVYVLDGDMKTIGKLEDLAPGENIFSARFIGDRGYLVTFKKIDPLFVIDLSDPNNPKVLGKLKIPGFSDYLHPYDENHIIGVGKEAVEAEEGNFAWYQGIKLALFDVSDPENPKEVSKYVIGHRGTDSYALQDHKAFLFSKSKNLLVIPILLAEINPEQYGGKPPANAYGEYVWQGAYVFELTKENGFVLKGRITHVDDESAFKKAGYYYFGGGDSVKRSLYISNVLYTISDVLIKMNDLADLDELNKIELPFEEQVYPIEETTAKPLPA